MSQVPSGVTDWCSAAGVLSRSEIGSGSDWESFDFCARLSYTERVLDKTYLRRRRAQGGANVLTSGASGPQSEFPPLNCVGSGCEGRRVAK
jgi:hypothetical protein